MQALSFAVHIPLVCFGIAFPAMVLFVEWLLPAHRRPALPHARAALDAGHGRAVRRRRRSPARSSASRWGCCGRTSRRRSAASSGSASRSRASRSSSRRSSSASTSTAGTGCRRARTSLSGIPIVIAGFTGSLMVIAVNGWMNHPAGFRLVRRRRSSTCTRGARCSATATSGTSWCTCTSPATSSPASCVAGAYAVGRLRGRWGRYERTALAIPLTIAALAAPVQVLVGDWAAREVADAPAGQARRARGPARTRRSGAPEHLLGWYDGRRGQVRDRDPASCSRCSPSTTRTRRVQGLDAVPADDRPAGQRRALRVPDDGRDRHAARAARRCSCSSCACGAGGCPSRAGSTARVVRRRAAVGRRADRRLGRRPRSAASRGSSTA